MPIYTNYSVLQNKSYKKLCLILGFGGHGSACLGDHLKNKEIGFRLILANMDDGGCTGRMQKYLKSAIQNINAIGSYNFNKNKDPIALGDLKNNIKVWLTNSLQNKPEKEAVEQIFECRSNDSSEFKNNFYKLAQIFPFLQKYWSSFCLLSESYLDVLSKSQDSGEKTSFGNLFLQLIYNQSSSSREFLNELKANGMTPDNVDIYFLTDYQLTLKAETKSGRILNSEAELDICLNDPVKIESYELYNPKNQKLTADDILSQNIELKDLFDEFSRLDRKNGYILFPPGSISNLFPLLNNLSQKIKDLNLPILWFTNAFIQGNEEKLEVQIEKMHGMFAGNETPLLVLGASQNPFDLVEPRFKERLQAAYFRENKTQIDQNAVALMMQFYNKTTVYLPNLDMVEIEGAGLKYRVKQIDNYINAIVNIWQILTKKQLNSDELLNQFVEVLKKMVPEGFRYKIYPELLQSKDSKRLIHDSSRFIAVK